MKKPRSQKSCQYSKYRTTQYIKWVMYAHINLGIGYKKRPKKSKVDPFFEYASEGEYRKCGHTKMIGSMVGYKAVAAGTPLQQQPYMTGKIWILAGAEAVKIYFEKPGTYHIGDGQRTDEGQAPEQSFFPVV